MEELDLSKITYDYEVDFKDRIDILSMLPLSFFTHDDEVMQDTEVIEEAELCDDLWNILLK